ncbi:MAG: hypothetical protein HY314_07670 [Acidobacteria bacterium]|nr:hypothetical protein [Acidobacteriota bacterium]
MDNRGNFWIVPYGPKTFGDLFTARQQLAMVTFSNQIGNKSDNTEVLAMAISRLANASASICRWHESGEKLEGVFSRQALPMVWDFCEGNPFSDATGGFDGALDWIVRVVDLWPKSSQGLVQVAHAGQSPLPD